MNILETNYDKIDKYIKKFFNEDDEEDEAEAEE